MTSPDQADEIAGNISNEILFQLASALNPKLRTICIDNGERMLPAKLKELNEWAEANDYQIIIFRASDFSDGCEFYLQEGRLKNNENL